MKIEKGFITVSIRILLALTLSVIILSFPFHTLESFFYDLRFKLNPFQNSSHHIELITIDPSTLQTYKGEPLLADHIQLLKKLLKEKPAVIYYVMDPKNIVGSTEEKFYFSKLLTQFPNHILYMKELPNKGEEYKTIVGIEYPNLRYSPGYLSTDFQHFAEDNVARRALITAEGYVYSQVKAANEIQPVSNFEDYRGAFQFRTSKQIYVNYQPTGTYKPTSFQDVISEKNLPGQFKNKVVLIGLDTQSDYNDYVKTVYNNKNFAMSNIEAQANIIATLIENNGIIRSPFILDACMTMIFSLIILFSVLRLRPAKGLQVVFMIVALYSALSWILFSFWGYAVGMAHPFLAIFVCYYFFIPYRLIVEGKKSWELSQKNQLLIQVEELKNNFLSLMSHDLKTPLARIQGMADVALSKKDNLVPEQIQALGTIKKSTEELTEFITNILDLSRVESQQIKLNLKPKDVNELLEETISKYRYLAEEKNIEITTEFEPLFSVKLDSELMRQVFGNLIENAIKYSPNNTKILITTEESNGLIVIQVADQGIGISETEIKHLFTKFYRTKNTKNSQIKGSGLGLYLSKYFVELHKGQIHVESIPQQGSTFTIEIPTHI